MDHLSEWIMRNREQGDQLAEAIRVVSDLSSANSVALWSYSQAVKVQGLTRIHGDTPAPLSSSWRDIMCQPRALRPHSRTEIGTMPGLDHPGASAAAPMNAS